MIDFLVNLNSILGLMAMKEKEMREFEKAIEKISNLQASDASLERIKEMVSVMQSVTSRMQSIIRKLESIEVLE